MDISIASLLSQIDLRDLERMVAEERKARIDAARAEAEAIAARLGMTLAELAGRRAIGSRRHAGPSRCAPKRYTREDYKARADAGMTQADAARDMGVSSVTVSLQARRYGLTFTPGKSGRPRKVVPA